MDGTTQEVYEQYRKGGKLITARLEWAMLYISKNAKKAQQRKTKKNRTLDGIFEMFNS
jgi:hypothetical protein